jgi:hypothetical protein
MYLQPVLFTSFTGLYHRNRTQYVYIYTDAGSLELMVSPLERIWKGVGGVGVKSCSVSSTRMTCNVNINWRGFYTPFETGVGGISEHQMRYTCLILTIMPSTLQGKSWEEHSLPV